MNSKTRAHTLYRCADDAKRIVSLAGIMGVEVDRKSQEVKNANFVALALDFHKREQI